MKHIKELAELEFIKNTPPKELNIVLNKLYDENKELLEALITATKAMDYILECDGVIERELYLSYMYNCKLIEKATGKKWEDINAS